MNIDVPHLIAFFNRHRGGPRNFWWEGMTFWQIGGIRRCSAKLNLKCWDICRPTLQIIKFYILLT